MLPVPDLITDFDVLLVADGLDGAGIRLMLDTAGALHCRNSVRAQVHSMTAVTLHAPLTCC